MSDTVKTNPDQTWRHLFDHELQAAAQARASHNEGKTRVCARRAAGIAIGEYFRHHGIPFENPSAVDRLKYLQNLPEISPRARQAAHLLLLRVTPAFSLPIEADLIAEARQLVVEILDDI